MYIPICLLADVISNLSVPVSNSYHHIMLRGSLSHTPKLVAKNIFFVIISIIRYGITLNLPDINVFNGYHSISVFDVICS